MNDVLTLEEAIKWRNSLKNRTLAITNGCFDLLHYGHISYLMEASKLADEMLILVNSDESVKSLKGNNRPIINQFERSYILSKIKPVSKVVIFDNKNCSKELGLLKPDVYFKAGDYNLENINKEEYNTLLQCNSKIVFVPFVSNISTTKIIEKIMCDKNG